MRYQPSDRGKHHLPKLRVGVGDIVDVKPLAWGFLKGHHADLFSTESRPLGMAGRMLSHGALDVGLVPTVDVARDPRLEVLPDLCVAFAGGCPVCTLAVYSPGDLGDVRRVYLGRHSRTSAAALRIILAESHGAEPEYREAPPSGRLEAGEAALVIGGAAMRPPDARFAPPEALQRLDLASAWRDLTGLPLVAGVWAVRPGGVDLPDLPFYFKSSLRFGLSSIGAIARESAAELGIDSVALADYLRSGLTYFLQDDERAGIDELLRRSVHHGILPEGTAIRFRSP